MSDLSPAVYEHLVKRAVHSFVSTRTLFSSQIISYEHYLHTQIPSIIKENSPIKVVSSDKKRLQLVHMSNVWIGKPVIKEANGFIRALRPKEAFQRRQSYMVDVFVDLHHETFVRRAGTTNQYDLVEARIYRNVLFFKTPCMWGSSACTDYESMTSMRTKGSFIINGYEKCLIAQESLKCNYPYISKDRGSKFSYKCTVRSDHPFKIRSTSTLYMYITGKKTNTIPSITVRVPFINHHIPLVVIFRLLGVQSVQEMHNFILGTNPSESFAYLLRSILCMDTTGTADMKGDALHDWVGQRGSSEKNTQKRIKYIRHIFNNEFLPHCKDPLYKAFYLGYCVRKLCRAFLGEITVDNLDSYQNKRAAVAGTLMALLTRQLIRKAIKNVQMQMFRNDKKRPISDFFNYKRITSGLKYAFSTGNWGVQKGGGNQSGVCQAVNNMNRCSTLAHKRQFNTPLNRDGKQSARRMLRNDHLGILCSNETPEGKSVGLTATGAFLTQVRLDCPSYFVIHILHEDLDVLKLQDVMKLDRSTMFLVLVNGIPCGVTHNALELLQKYRLYRRWHCVPQNSSISYDRATGEISINSDQDDCYRPVFCLKHFHKFGPVFREYGRYPHLFWERLLIEGVIEYVNKLEEATLNIAMDLSTCLASWDNYTHLEIHPSFTLNGTSAGVIPCSEHNQAPRNIYQSAMGKQAVSSQALDFCDRLENKTYNLVYPQVPLVQTWTGQLSGYNDAPAGQAVVTAIQCWSGYNQEDSSIISRQAIDNGLFYTAVYRTYKDSEANHGADIERFGKCETSTGRKKGDYSKIGDNGLVRVGQKLVKGDAIIGKTIEFTHIIKNRSEDFKSERKVRDRSICVKSNEPATVEKVLMHTTKDNLKSVSVRTVAYRKPQIGDKFSSLHGQKGICGMVVSPEDMPFTASGLRVDLMINCHSFPSRMTIGHARETLFGKAACLEGKIADGTPFRGKSTEEIQQILHNNGFQKFGKEVVYDGKTGKRLKNPVFIGVTYYQRLKHMVQDKGHARSTGPVQHRTRQPLEGRSRDGGLRVGEMERDSIISHGASAAAIDRLLTQSDGYKTVICRQCGMLAEPAAEDGKEHTLHARPYCRFCQSHEHVVPVMLPYAMKLMWQEWLACHVFFKHTLE
uniref:DNA-directed RNA polymerase n=1 Tax=viral metagenome TaxID=1070528 RepID=A0A6C0BQT2_9ZZZZ